MSPSPTMAALTHLIAELRTGPRPTPADFLTDPEVGNYDQRAYEAALGRWESNVETTRAVLEQQLADAGAETPDEIVLDELDRIRSVIDENTVTRDTLLALGLQATHQTSRSLARVAGLHHKTAAARAAEANNTEVLRRFREKELELMNTPSTALPAVVLPAQQHLPSCATHDDSRALQIPIALGSGSRVSSWHPSRDGHLMAIGNVGAGTSTVLHHVIQSAAQAAWRVWLLDGRRLEFAGYRDWPNVEFVAQTPEAHIRLLHLAHETMEARYTLMREAGLRTQADLDPIVVVIHSLDSLLAFATQTYRDTKEKGMPAKAPMLEWIANLARLGRAAKVHLVVEAQRPDVSLLGELGDNFGYRITLGHLSPEALRLVWGADLAPRGMTHAPGRGIARVSGGPGTVQAIYAPAPGHEFSAWASTRRPHNPARISPKLIPAPSASDGELTWTKIITTQITDTDSTPLPPTYTFTDAPHHDEAPDLETTPSPTPRPFPDWAAAEQALATDH